MSGAEHPFPWSEDAVCRPSAENDVPVWCHEHMEPYCPRHAGQSAENDAPANDCVACDVEQLLDVLGPYWSIPFWPSAWIYLRFRSHVCERDCPNADLHSTFAGMECGRCGTVIPPAVTEDAS